MTNQQAAMARALGLLDALVQFGHIPAAHLDRAQDIVAQYRTPGDDHEWPAFRGERATTITETA